MGTHPIFESDFDCLTEFMNVLHVGETFVCFLDEQSLRLIAGGRHLRLLELDSKVECACSVLYEHYVYLLLKVAGEELRIVEINSLRPERVNVDEIVDMVRHGSSRFEQFK